MAYQLSKFLAGVLAVACAGTAASNAVADVRVVSTATDCYHLEVDGKPFFVQGAGGDGSKQLLKDCGGNAFRTWGADRIDKELAEAQRLGLKVLVGIWLEHERHGFNYADAGQVAAQEEKAKAVIQRLKGNPAVLGWGIGNEMEGYAAGDNPNIWNSVERIAAYAKSVDADHPTFTVIAEVGGKKVPSLHQYCPHIDIVGINTYGGAASIPQRYRAAGGTKPYVITEFGPIGTWEVSKTDWGVVPEPTSTAKGAMYRSAYEKAIAAEKDKLCLGSFAFIWGAKQEATATWFGMLLPDGTRLAATDVMQELWSGKAPANRVPTVSAIKLLSQKVKPGDTLDAKLTSNDPENDPLTAEWILREEPEKYGEGGDHEAAPATVDGAVVSSDISGAKVKVPAHGGRYRLFVTIRDNHGGAATANVPLLAADKP